MSEPLELKYRPKTWEEVRGNKTNIESILGVLVRKRFFVFYGIRGCGKTTVARLLAKELKVHRNSLFEYNMADKTGVDFARELIGAAYLRPLYGDRKLYVLDEGHRMSGPAQDSLLKLLEEPPAAAYFVLCTTNIDKVLPTIKSRAASYLFGPLVRRELNDFLQYVMGEEGIEVSSRVLRAVMVGSEGIPRDALILLDMVRDVKEEEGAVTLALTGSVQDKSVRDLVDELKKNKPRWEEARKIIQRMDLGDVEKTRKSVLWLLGVEIVSSDDPYRIALVAENFEDPMYDSGKAGFFLSVYRACEIVKEK